MVRFVGIVLLIGLVAGCSPKQPVPVRIGYVETDVPSSSQCGNNRVLSRAGRISYEWHIPKTGR